VDELREVPGQERRLLRSVNRLAGTARMTVTRRDRGDLELALLHRERIVVLPRGALRLDVETVGERAARDAVVRQIGLEGADVRLRLAELRRELADREEAAGHARVDLGLEQLLVARVEDERHALGRRRRRRSERRRRKDCGPDA